MMGEWLCAPNLCTLDTRQFAEAVKE
jgi:hypothetical protein